MTVGMRINIYNLTNDTEVVHEVNFTVPLDNLYLSVRCNSG